MKRLLKPGLICSFENKFSKRDSCMANGKDIVRIAMKHIGEEYILGADVPKDDPDWDGPWDCAEFVSWCIYQAAKILYGVENDHGDPAHANAYTGFFARDVDTIGEDIDLEDAYSIPGAILLRKPGYHSIQYGHVVISDGKGGTIEAMDHSHGVVTSHAGGRPWTHGILVPGIDYQKGGEVIVDPPKPAPGWPRILYYTQPNIMKGEDVTRLQKLLNEKGNLGFLVTVDGKFGKQTMNAVIAFQKKMNVVVDGMVGPQTIKILSK
jgi:N-acetylmuramoyl-L-alanine amidase